MQKAQPQPMSTHIPRYPTMYQAFVMEAPADATRCCIIVILLAQLSLQEWGCIKGKHGGITPPNINTSLDFLKMGAEMIPDQVPYVSPSVLSDG